MSELKSYIVDYYGKLKKLLFVVAFFGFIMLPVVQMLSNFLILEEVESFDEKREMVKWDDVQASSLDTLISSYGSYFKDNFGFRDHFISLNNRWKIQQFKVSPHNAVIIGDKGWYFYNAGYSKEDHSGKHKLTESDLNELKNNLRYKKDFIEKQGGKFYLVVFPDKMTIYPQHLPNSMYNSGGTRFDQVLKYFKRTDIDIIDLRAALIDESKKRLVYQKTDSHCNQNGGFRAYREIMNYIKRDFPDLRAYDRKQFDIIQESEQTGDLTTLVGVRNYEDNLRYSYSLKPGLYKGKAQFLEEYQGYDVSYKATFSYLNPTLKQPKLMMLNDSYINYIHQFLGNHFSESHYFWHQNFIESRVNEIQPDIFIQMIVERNLEELVNLDLE